MLETTVNKSSIPKFEGLNQPITIEPPLTTGEGLLPGWRLQETFQLPPLPIGEPPYPTSIPPSEEEIAPGFLSPPKAYDRVDTYLGLCFLV